MFIIIIIIIRADEQQLHLISKPNSEARFFKLSEELDLLRLPDFFFFFFFIDLSLFLLRLLSLMSINLLLLMLPLALLMLKPLAPLLMLKLECMLLDDRLIIIPLPLLLLLLEDMRLNGDDVWEVVEVNQSSPNGVVAAVMESSMLRSAI